MGFSIKDAGTLRSIRTLWIKQAGVMRRIRTLKVMNEGTLRTVAVFSDPLAVSAPNASSTGSSSTQVTNSVTATATGGFAPYSYQWTLVSSEGSTPSTDYFPRMASRSFR